MFSFFLSSRKVLEFLRCWGWMGQGKMWFLENYVDPVYYWGRWSCAAIRVCQDLDECRFHRIVSIWPKKRYWFLWYTHLSLLNTKPYDVALFISVVKFKSCSCWLEPYMMISSAIFTTSFMSCSMVSSCCWETSCDRQRPKGIRKNRYITCMVIRSNNYKCSQITSFIAKDHGSVAGTCDAFVVSCLTPFSSNTSCV